MSTFFRLLTKLYSQICISIFGMVIFFNPNNLQVLRSPSVDQALASIRDLRPKNIKHKKNIFNYLSAHDGAIIDLGANIGHMSLVYKELYPKRDIWAIEPNPQNFSFITRNLRNKGISFLPIGLSNKMEFVNFKMPSYVSENALDEKNTGRMQVDVSKNITYSSILLDCQSIIKKIHSITKIGFIKIDVEGYEAEILKDLLPIIEEINFPVIQFEYNKNVLDGDGIIKIKNILSNLKDLGYNLYFERNNIIEELNLNITDFKRAEIWVTKNYF